MLPLLALVMRHNISRLQLACASVHGLAVITDLFCSLYHWPTLKSANFDPYAHVP